MLLFRSKISLSLKQVGGIGRIGRSSIKPNFCCFFAFSNNAISSSSSLRSFSSLESSSSTKSLNKTISILRSNSIRPCLNNPKNGNRKNQKNSKIEKSFFFFSTESTTANVSHNESSSSPTTTASVSTNDQQKKDFLNFDSIENLLFSIASRDPKKASERRIPPALVQSNEILINTFSNFISSSEKKTRKSVSQFLNDQIAPKLFHPSLQRIHVTTIEIVIKNCLNIASAGLSDEHKIDSQEEQHPLASLSDVSSLILKYVDSGFWMRPSLFTFLIRHLVRKGNEKAAFDLYSELRRRMIKLDTFCYNCLLNTTIGKASDEMSQELFRSMKHDGVNPDIYTFVSLIQMQLQRKNLITAKKYWTEMLEKNIVPNVGLFNLMITAYLKKNDLEEAQALLSMMRKKFGLKPDILTYNVFIDFKVKNDELEDAVALFTEMKNAGGVLPDTITFNMLIGAFIKLKKYDQVFQLEKEMTEKYHLKPDTVTFNMLSSIRKLGGADSSSSSSSSSSSTETTTKNQQQQQKFKISLRHPKKDDIVSAKDFVSSLEESPSSSSSSSSLSSFSSSSVSTPKETLQPQTHGQTSEQQNNILQNNEIITKTPKQVIDGIAQSYQSSGNKPDQYTMNRIIGAYIARGDIASALSAQSEMKERFGVEPDIVSFFHFINFYVKTQNEKAALGIILQMHEAGIRMNTYVINSFINACPSGRGGSDKLVLTLFNEMKEFGIEPDLITYNSIIKFYVKSGQIDLAAKCMSELLASGNPKLSPDVFTFNSLLSGYAKKGNIDKINELIQLMDSKGKRARPDAVTFNSLLESIFIHEQSLVNEPKTVARMGKVQELALRVLRQFSERGIVADAITLRTILSGFMKVFRDAILEPANREQVSRILLGAIDSTKAISSISAYNRRVIESIEQGLKSKDRNLLSALKDSSMIVKVK